jgi:acyl-CoA hydrolase/GNAT superfamily N-acetyltransferase
MGLKAALAAAGWRDKTVTAEQAVAMLPNGAYVFLSSGCATPTTFLAALEDAAHQHPGVRLHHFMTRAAPDRERRAVLRHRAFYLSHDLLPLMSSGTVDYIPLILRDVVRLTQMGRLSFNAAVVQVSEPDAAGMCSLGASVGLGTAMIQSTPLVIAEINPAMPRTRGETLVPFDVFHAVIEVEPRMLIYEPTREMTAVVKSMAEYVARLVQDGSTLHTGPGLLISEVLSRLDRHRDLGVHSDVISDSVIDLMESGVITGRFKSMSRGRVVTSYAMGTQRLYDAIDNNKAFTFRPIEQISDPNIIARQSRMVSITEASTVDLTGQVCAESRNGQPYGGVGSTPMFHYGAARSEGGRAIVCLPSTDADGHSSIKGVLGPNEPVTIPRYEAHWIITEYGPAFLYGSTTRQRAVALIEIAHPDHRDVLLAQAKELGLVPSDQKLRSRRSYPMEEERHVTLKNGLDVLIRPTRATDAPLLQDLFYRLKAEDVRTRFFRNLSTLTRQMAEHLTSVTYDQEMAFAAVIGEEEHERIIGTSSYYLDPSTRLAEVAYLVDTDYQRQGLGQALHARTIQYAAAHGIRGFTADVLGENHAMIAVFTRGPGKLEMKTRYGVTEIVLEFTALDEANAELAMV